MKYKVETLDLVIIRSCQLSCQGCCTFSDHKKINGLTTVAEAESAVAFWSQYIEPVQIHLFGGEPTMHPELIEWFRLVRRYWPTEGSVWLSTNGYFFDKIFEHVDELFVDNNTSISITHHTTDEPYSSLVLNNYVQLQQLILERYNKLRPTLLANWITETSEDSSYKEISYLKDRHGNNLSALCLTHQAGEKFIPHYRGHGESLKPWFDYSDDMAKINNHSVCHIKNYVELYQNRLWKCPPRAVLNQTLETYKLQDSEDWKQYYNDYKSLGQDATDAEIAAWFQAQKTPENTCNMCGFQYSQGRYSIPAQQHLPKKLFKIKSI